MRNMSKLQKELYNMIKENGIMAYSDEKLRPFINEKANGTLNTLFRHKDIVKTTAWNGYRVVKCVEAV